MISREHAVRHATEAWRTASRRNREHFNDGKIHVSALHECPRQVQLRYRRTPATDEITVRLNLRAQIGTAIHDYYLPLLAEQWAADPEVEDVLIDDQTHSTEVSLGPVVAHPDMVVNFTDGSFAIVELKTGAKYLVKAAKGGEPKRSHLDQCRVGGLIAENQTGAPMRGYWIYYIDIEDPEHNWEMTTRTWTDSEVEAATTRLQHGLALAGDEAAPRWFGKHTADAFAPYSPCISCEFKSGCLGKDNADPLRDEAATELVEAGARFGKQLRTAENDLMEFLRLRANIDKPKRGKAHVMDVISHLGLEEGPYDANGAVHHLKYRPGYDKDDGPASAKILRSLGKDVPQTHVDGHYRIE